jgi:RimJ/RimL family protein N-acetyltransferase
MNVQFRLITLNNTIKIIIQHDLGKNWPFFIITQMNSILNEIGYRIINEDYNNQGFSFEIVKAGDE